MESIKKSRYNSRIELNIIYKKKKEISKSLKLERSALLDLKKEENEKE
jgi:hypothetical protein